MGAQQHKVRAAHHGTEHHLEVALFQADGGVVGAEIGRLLGPRMEADRNVLCVRRHLRVVGGEESKERTAATVLDVEGRRVILFLEQRDVVSGQQGVEELEDTVLQEVFRLGALRTGGHIN